MRLRFPTTIPLIIIAALPGVAQQAQTQQFARQQTSQAAAASQQSMIVEEIIARVNSSIITRADLQRSKDSLQEESNKADSQGMDKPKEQDLLRDLIDQQLLLQKGTELGVSADTDVVKRLDQLRQQMHADSMEDLEKAAQAQGVSFEDFKQNL